MKSIIAFDQSTHLSGYSYWQDGKFISSGILKAKDIKEMYNLIEMVLNKYLPDEVVIEDMFFLPQSAKSGVPLARLQGLIIGMCYERDISLYIVTANKWRKTLGVNTYRKNTEELKKEVQTIIENKYKIKVETNDESDAVGIGYWYWYCNKKELNESNFN